MNFFKQFLGLSSASILYLLSQLGVLAALTQLTTLQVVAIFGFTTALTQSGFMFAQFGLREALATDAHHEHQFPVYVSLRLVLTVVFLAVMIATIVATRPEYLAVALPFIVSKTMELQNEFAYGVMQKWGKTNLISRSLLLRGPCTMILFLAVLWGTRSAEIAFWSQVLVWSAVLVLHDIPSATKLGYRPALSRRVTEIWRLARQCLPLGIGRLMSALQTNVPRFLVEFHLGSTALALFTVVSYLQRAALSVFDSLEQTLMWRLSRSWNSGDLAGFYRTLGVMSSGAIAAGAVGVIAAWWIGVLFLGVFFGAEYAKAETLLIWIALATAFRLLTAVFQTALYVKRKFSQFGFIQTLSLVLTLPAVLIGMAKFGLDGVGAGIAVVALLRTVVTGGFLLQRGISKAPQA